MDLAIDGKRALVTGASSGIGRGIAHALAAEGVRLAICGRDPTRLGLVAAELRGLRGGEPAVVAADLGRPGGVETAATAARAALGGIDILVNNAGGSRPLPQGASEEFWDEAFALNFTAARRLTEALLPDMRQGRWGRVINITGAIAQKTVNAATPAKVALLSWSRALAGEVARDGITVNCIAPGRINSAQILERLYPTDEARQRFAAENIPMGRFGEPSELAALAAFLASPLAGYITAASIPVDGGMYRLDLR
ncbi:MAG: SDR family oxidoreductase [Alphaproteobacteria bacterium]|nr:SDR family oxidoreductase [Alphaproteobacteria bacterium]